MVLGKLCESGTCILALAMAVLLASGCSGNHGRQEVSGTVTVDGAPVTKGLVNFQPTDAANSRGSGATLRDGGFQLSTADGLLPGKYVVTVQAFKESGRILNDPMMGKVPEIVPVALAQSSVREAIVVSDGPNRFDFQLTSVNAAKR